MRKTRLASLITDFSHYIEECLDFLLALTDMDVYITQTDEKVLKTYGINI
jgi:hypothetical protein